MTSIPGPRPSPAAVSYRLVRGPLAAPLPPVPDRYQQAVIDHPGGPLLVLAGPGTGKTTTLVEAVAARVARGTDPERVLVLTFSRRAAVRLRDRITARLGAGGLRTATPQATTFHSFCYALVRAHQDRELFADPLRLLSGPEQDVLVRELLAGHAAGADDGAGAGEAAGPGGGAEPPGGVRWPDDLRACLTTRGFADEVRAVLARSRELGLGPAALARFAARAGRPDWSAAAAFYAEYLDVLDLHGVLDYAELVHRAVLLAERPEVAAELRRRYRVVFVDEYQDTDPAQVRLLRALAGGGGDVVAFGDPDQSIYAFRGADMGGILDFPRTFRRADGSPADVKVLRVSRRAGSLLLAASREVARRMPVSRLPADRLAEHRALVPVRAGGRVEVLTHPTPGVELENIADILRRAHLEDRVPWGEMAVLVRAGARSIPGVRRALAAAGVPLEIDGEDIPLRAEPAVAPLLLALRVTAEWAARSQGRGRQDAPDPLTREVAHTLLTGPLGGLDAADLRRLGRALREEERRARAVADTPGHASEHTPDHVPDCASGEDPAGGGRPPGPPGASGGDGSGSVHGAVGPLPPAAELVREALAEPERLVALEPAAARRARDLGILLRAVRDLLVGGATAEEALWALWDGTPRWRERLERAALRGGPAGRNADRDLDAVCALFETAARAEERTGHRGALNFLAEVEAQDIAADTLSGRVARPDAVRLMTAHRAKGLEWRLVVVAGVQEGLWPDLRRRGSLLEADRIGRDGLAEPLTPGALLAEERRLFYTAITRARERLVVTAVKAQAEDGDEPSRFLRELYRERTDARGTVVARQPEVTVEDATRLPRRPLSLAALVAELRATTVDPAASPGLRAAAARRLARLAAAVDADGLPLVPAAHPDRWWGMVEPTRNDTPVRDRLTPVQLSGSALEQLQGCSLQWFLDREVRARTSASAAQGFGNVVHVLADEVASGRTPADLEVLTARLDTVWDALAFEAPWRSEQERREARAALERFLRWHAQERGRTVVAAEHPFDVTLKTGEVAVRIRGSMDRVERGSDGLAYVVDFKTGRTPPAGTALPSHPQLAVYQLAVREGALDGLADAFGGEPPDTGGAELVHLRVPRTGRDGASELPKVQAQEALPAVAGPGGGRVWIERLLAEAAARVLDERFVPTTGPGCDRCAFHRSCSARPEGRQVVE